MLSADQNRTNQITVKQRFENIKDQPTDRIIANKKLSQISVLVTQKSRHNDESP